MGDPIDCQRAFGLHDELPIRLSCPMGGQPGKGFELQRPIRHRLADLHRRSRGMNIRSVPVVLFSSGITVRFEPAGLPSCCTRWA